MKEYTPKQIKQLKANVDVLTLTATPIPRTLHMSMLGVRDLSVIETPPENRFPVLCGSLDIPLGSADGFMGVDAQQFQNVHLFVCRIVDGLLNLLLCLLPVVDLSPGPFPAHRQKG